MTEDPAQLTAVTATVNAVLAIDLGLKTGFAVFDESGALVCYRSTRFPSNNAVKRAAWNVLRGFPELSHVFVEGDKTLAGYWRKAAEKQGLQFATVTPEIWRAGILLPRERRDSTSAKKAAFTLADEIIRASDAPDPTGELTSDVAEAVLIGRWAAAHLGWADTPTR